MAPVKRHLLTLFSALSFALLLLTIAIWIRSYFVLDRFVRWDNFRTYGPWTDWVHDQMVIGRGGIGFCRSVVGEQSTSPSRYRSREIAFMSRFLNQLNQALRPIMYQAELPAYPDFRFEFYYNDATVFGFNLSRFERTIPAGQNPTHRSRGTQLILPLWSIALLFCILPALWTRRWRASRRRDKVGFCSTCGYDLRASKDRCPECGTEIPINAESCCQDRIA